MGDELKRLREHLDDKRTTVRLQTIQINELKLERDSLQQRVDQLEQNNSDISHREANIMSREQTLIDNIAHVQAQINLVNGQVQKHIKEDALHIKLELLDDRVESLENENKSLNSTIQMMADDYNETAAKLLDKDRTINSLNSLAEMQEKKIKELKELTAQYQKDNYQLNQAWGASGKRTNSSASISKKVFNSKNNMVQQSINTMMFEQHNRKETPSSQFQHDSTPSIVVGNNVNSKPTKRPLYSSDEDACNNISSRELLKRRSVDSPALVNDSVSSKRALTPATSSSDSKRALTPATSSSDSKRALTPATSSSDNKRAFTPALTEQQRPSTLATSSGGSKRAFTPALTEQQRPTSSNASKRAFTPALTDHREDSFETSSIVSVPPLAPPNSMSTTVSIKKEQEDGEQDMIVDLTSLLNSPSNDRFSLSLISLSNDDSQRLPPNDSSQSLDNSPVRDQTVLKPLTPEKQSVRIPLSDTTNTSRPLSTSNNNKKIPLTKPAIVKTTSIANLSRQVSATARNRQQKQHHHNHNHSRGDTCLGCQRFYDDTDPLPNVEGNPNTLLTPKDRIALNSRHAQAQDSRSKRATTPEHFWSIDNFPTFSP